jgi:hypothetical protein
MAYPASLFPLPIELRTIRELSCSPNNTERKAKNIREKYKKPSKLPVFYNITLKCSKDNKVVSQTINE